MVQRASSGGAAAAAGMDFQYRVTAWVAALILAEKDASPPWGLPAGTTLEWFRCQTEHPVDDLLVGTSAEGLVFGQIKRNLKLSPAPDSDLASALDQFVRQFVACRAETSGTRAWNRPLDSERDRLLLITSSRTPQLIRLHLFAVLSRLRDPHVYRPLSDAAANNEERRALSVVEEHLRRSWQRVLGIEPSEEDLRELLSLVHVHVLDVEEGGSGEREAMNLLRGSVLQDPDQADAAWAQLASLASSLAAQRSGADRPGLQRLLLDAGFRLKAARSYREDIERLGKYSATTSDALAQFAQIHVGSATVKIQRPYATALKQAAEEGSILVVGEPGAGKSGVLHDLAETLREERRDYIFLAVDRLPARSLGELRMEIGLEHDLAEVLENWPGLQSAFVLIDALDAARGEPAEAMIRDLIHEVGQKSKRWRVVASIRKFDLRYSEEIKRLFPGAPPTEFQDPEFRGVRHLNVRRLSDSELDQIASQSAELDALVRSAPPELRELLRVPFNLQLLGELLGAGVSPDDLTPIKTELELLDKYWKHRICHDKHGDAREAVLRDLCEKMVEERTLRLDRSAVARPETGIWLHDLLSAQILVEWQPSPEAAPERYIVAFSHNVLFDYAVARLLLRGTPEGLVRRLVNDPDLVVAIRPSLVLYFRHLWTADSNHEQFWDLVFQVIQADQIPEVGKLIGPSVAAELTRGLPDLEPLCVTLDDPGSANQAAAEQALRHVVGALLAAPASIRVQGPGAGPWSQFLERVSRDLRPAVAYPVRSLLATMCEHPEDFTPEQRNAAGQTARRLLEFAWSHTPRDAWLVIHGLQCVCRTFESDPAASAALIRRCLKPPHLSQHGFEEMPWLAREVKRLISLDGQLVEEIFRAAFTYEERSEEPTPLSQSRILPLIFTRRQDYQMARYELAEVFPEFLERAPENATRALIGAMEAYVVQRHRLAPGEWQEVTFDLAGRRARFLADYSAIWDEGDTYRDDEPLKMLDAFQRYLETLVGQENGVEQFRALLEILVAENRLAALWRRVLFVGTRFPGIVGRAILPLALAMPVLTGSDTSTAAREFVRAVFPTLDPEARGYVERAILSIPETVPADRRQTGEHIRNRLLGCLAAGDLVTDEARRLLEDLKSKHAVQPDEPPALSHEVGSGIYGEEEYLRVQGVPVDAEPNRRIRELERRVQEFEKKYLNSAPTVEEACEALPVLQALYEALCRADTDGVHPKQRDHAWDTLAGACACIARVGKISCNAALTSLVREVLLGVSRHPEPAYQPEYDQFDEHPSWGRPAPRIVAAEGLVVLASHPEFDSRIRQAVESLSSDPVPAVRFQIASRLNVLYRTAPDLMWRIAERMGREESSRGVLQGLLAYSLRRIAGAEPDRVADLTKLIVDRVREGPGAGKVRELCMGLFAALYVWRDQTLSGEVVLEVASNTASFPNEAHHILHTLREAVMYGPTSPPDPKADAVRQRALDLLERLLRSARRGLDELEQRNRGVPFNQWPQRDQDEAKSLYRLIDRIGAEVYFASGAHDERRQQEAPTTRGPESKSERFYGEAATILDVLAETGLPSVAHHLLETLEFFIPCDPRGVFLRIGHVIRAGKQEGYQYESLAADLIVKLVERYLADYRALLRADSECRQVLIEILDTFVQAGWPSARRLAYRLEEIFR